MGLLLRFYIYPICGSRNNVKQREKWLFGRADLLITESSRRRPPRHRRTTGYPSCEGAGRDDGDTGQGGPQQVGSEGGGQVPEEGQQGKDHRVRGALNAGGRVKDGIAVHKTQACVGFSQLPEGW